MDIRNHLETLANGDGNQIVDGMKNELDIVSTFMNDLSISAEKLTPETRLHWFQSKQIIQTAEKNATVLDKHAKRVDDLENKRPVREYLRLQQEMRNTRSPIEYGKLNRQIKQLKDSASRDLSDLVSNQHQVLLKRINLVNHWKSLLAVEIRVLEECKVYILQSAKSTAEASGDVELLDDVIQQIHLLQGPPHELEGYAVNLSALQTANIHVLRKTVKNQLDEVVKLEKLIAEKRIALNTLTDIAKRLNSGLPDELQQKPVEPVPTASDSGPQPNESRPPPSEESSAPSHRMAFRDKDKR